DLVVVRSHHDLHVCQQVLRLLQSVLQLGQILTHRLPHIGNRAIHVLDGVISMLAEGDQLIGNTIDFGTFGRQYSVDVIQYSLDFLLRGWASDGFQIGKETARVPLMPSSSPCACVMSALALSATSAILPAISSRLAASFDGIADPGPSRFASLLPVVIDKAALFMMLTSPSLATDFSFKGVPCLTSSRISIFVGSDVQGLTAVTLPTVIPPKSTSAPGSSPPA